MLENSSRLLENPAKLFAGVEFEMPRIVEGSAIFELDLGPDVRINDKPEALPPELTAVVCVPPSGQSMRSRLFVIEHYQLHIHRIAHGPGALVSTLSLLPGEDLEIQFSTTTETSFERERSTSVLDSNDQKIEENFEKDVQDQHNLSQGATSTQTWSVNVGARAKWGWGGASASAKNSSVAEQTRSELANSIRRAVKKRAQSESKTREVRVSTTTRESQTANSSTRVSRRIKNINLSAPVTYVLRQVVEHYASVLFLTDFSVVYLQADGKACISADPRRLDLLIDAIVPTVAGDDLYKALQNRINRHFQAVTNWRGETQALTQTKGTAVTVNRGWPQITVESSIGVLREVPTPGIALSCDEFQLTTSGVMVESYLGQETALDSYSQKLQMQATRTAEIRNDTVVIANTYLKILVDQAKTLSGEELSRIGSLISQTLEQLRQSSPDVPHSP